MASDSPIFSPENMRKILQRILDEQRGHQCALEMVLAAMAVGDGITNQSTRSFDVLGFVNEFQAKYRDVYRVDGRGAIRIDNKRLAELATKTYMGVKNIIEGLGQVDWKPVVPGHLRPLRDHTSVVCEPENTNGVGFLHDTILAHLKLLVSPFRSLLGTDMLLADFKALYCIGGAHYFAVGGVDAIVWDHQYQHLVLLDLKTVSLTTSSQGESAIPRFQERVCKLQSLLQLLFCAKILEDTWGSSLPPVGRVGLLGWAKDTGLSGVWEWDYSTVKYLLEKHAIKRSNTE